MSKLDWTKAGQRSSDPGRVVDVGDYGILPDRLAGRKGDVKVRKKRAKKKQPKPVTQSNPAKIPAPAASAKSTNLNKLVKSAKAKPPTVKPRGGLTIPEMVSRAKGKVDRLTSEIRREERKLAGLREQLKSAERQLQVAQDTPRRSAIGKALHEAQRNAGSNSTPRP